MDLKSLPVSHSERAVSKFIAEVQLGQHLLIRDFSPGNSAADHELIMPFATTTDIPVILLVSPAEFQQADVNGIEDGVRGLQFLTDGSAEVITLLFGSFYLTELFF